MLQNRELKWYEWIGPVTRSNVGEAHRFLYVRYLKNVRVDFLSVNLDFYVFIEIFILINGHIKSIKQW